MSLPQSQRIHSRDYHKTSVDGELKKAKEENNGTLKIMHNSFGCGIEAFVEACNHKI